MMVSLSIYAGEWSLIVPFTLDGIAVARKFIELLGKMLAEEAPP